jgi:predicted  nucleic acid-binding Zn-ribbon protein
MGAMLDALLALQDIELQIVDIRRQLASRQRTVRQQTAKLRAVEETLNAEREELKRSQAQMDEVDMELKSRSAHISRLRDNLNTVRTNKEYAAVLSQLNNEKADVTRLEARAFELLTGVEARKKALAERQAAVDQEVQRLAAVESQVTQAHSSFTDRLAALERQREAAGAALDPKALEMFNRISERYDGEVMARVIQVHPRHPEYLCEGCNMSLAAERANSLLTRDDVITCDNCGRILHMPKST